jgi:hypothetical protein
MLAYGCPERSRKASKSVPVRVLFILALLDFVVSALLAAFQYVALQNNGEILYYLARILTCMQFASCGLLLGCIFMCLIPYSRCGYVYLSTAFVVASLVLEARLVAL